VNIQPIEKRAHRADGLLAVHSVFQTIQGEGPFCGVPCVFVRLAGCNLQCPACDTDYTSTRQLTSPLSLLEQVFDADTMPGEDRKLVVITGGEPFRQDLSELLCLLVGAGYYVQIESNGTLNPTPQGIHWSYSTEPHRRRGVYVVCSPKTGKLNPSIFDVACALKYVVKYGDTHSDGLPLSALDHPSNPYPARPPVGWSRPIYVQPLDSKDPVENAAHTNEAVASCLRHGYTLQLQIHKHIGVE
jgi:organic radical activating enzyme